MVPRNAVLPQLLTWYSTRWVPWPVLKVSGYKPSLLLREHLDSLELRVIDQKNIIGSHQRRSRTFI